MKVDIEYHILPDPENSFNGHVNAKKSGGIQSVHLSFSPYELTEKQGKALGKHLQKLANQLNPDSKPRVIKQWPVKKRYKKVK